MKYDITAIGSAVMDVFLKSAEFKPGEPLPVGGKLEVEELYLTTGGGGTNTATGFARLGLKTACIARFGDDLFGKFVEQELEKESFNKDYLMVRLGDKTDYSTIIVYPDGSRVILVHRGKTRLDEAGFPWQILDETRWLYIASLEGNVDLLTQVVAKAKERGVKVALNPGSRELEEHDKLLSLFPKIEALILNLEEASLFTGEKEEKQVFAKISQLGPKIMVVTNGRKGAHLFSQGRHLFSEVFKTQTFDELGAGDAFSSGFVAGLVKGFSLEESLKLGMANGASVVTKIGAKTALLREDEIQEWLGKDLKIEQLS
jgi:2-dehydro-3-deoxygluconokinase